MDIRITSDAFREGEAIPIKYACFERIGYGGPCPPPKDSAHRYFFRLYALGAELRLGVGARREDLAEVRQ